MRKFLNCFLACMLAVTLVLSPVGKVEEAHANVLTAAQAGGYALATVLGLYGVDIAVNGLTDSDAEEIYYDFRNFVHSRTESDLELFLAAFSTTPTALGIQWGADAANAVLDTVDSWAADGRINLNDLTLAAGSAACPALLWSYIGACIENGAVPLAPYSYSQYKATLIDNYIDVDFADQDLRSYYAGYGYAGIDTDIIYGQFTEYDYELEAVRDALASDMDSIFGDVDWGADIYGSDVDWGIAIEAPATSSDDDKTFYVFPSYNDSATLALLKHGIYVDLFPCGYWDIYEKNYDDEGNYIGLSAEVPSLLWCLKVDVAANRVPHITPWTFSDYAVLSRYLNNYNYPMYVNPDLSFLSVQDPWHYSVAANFFNATFFNLAFASTGDLAIDVNRVLTDNPDVNLGRDWHKDGSEKIDWLIGLSGSTSLSAAVFGSDAVINGDYILNRGSVGVITDWSNIGSWSDVLTTSKAGLAESTLDGTLTLEAEGVASNVATGELVSSTVGSLAGTASGTSVSNTNGYNGFVASDLYLFFPFCLPWDLYNLVQVFNASAQAPVFSLPLSVPGIVDEDVEIDLSVFDPVMEVARTLELIAFAVGLVFLTKKMIEV